MLREVEVGRSGGHTAEVEGGRTWIRPIGSSGELFNIAYAIADAIGCAVARMLVIWAADSHGPRLEKL